MKIVFNPHIAGMGHKVRCNLIARKLKEIESGIKIKFLLRKDDPIPQKNWLDFEFVKGKWQRSYEIITTNCLIEDGSWFNDFRVKILSKVGGKIIAISNPYGFLPDYPTAKDRLKLTDLIIVPWPKKLFRWPEELSELKYKVRRIEPIIHIPEELKRKEHSYNIYVSISRETNKIFPVIQDAIKSLKNRLPNLKLLASSTYKDFKDETIHFKTILSSGLVITQGTQVLFESSYLGIPSICIPLPWVEDQMLTGKMMMNEGAIFSIPLNELSVEKLSNVIFDIFNNSSTKNEMVAKGRILVPKSGLNDAAKLILQTIA